MNQLRQLVRLSHSLLARSVELERRIAGSEFRGRVAVVDGARHAVKLVIGTTPEGEDVLSPWLPVSQEAGDMKLHAMPSVGQQGAAVSASGDIEQARFVPLHWSEGFEAPSDDPDVRIMELDDVRVTWASSLIRMQVGATVLELTPAGIRMNGQLVAIYGLHHTHNDTNIGDTHRHPGIEQGGSLTEEPV